LDELLSADRPDIPAGPPSIPAGLPSDLLRRRPDVRRAERELAAATARIGVATADLFPRFSLTGSLGLQSEEFSDLASMDSRFFNIGPSVSWPIFDAGRIRSNIRVQNARQEQALVRYEQSVLTALEDVENALVNYAKEQQRRQSLQRAVDANRRSVEMSQQLYDRGLTDFLDVLDAQRALFASEDALVQSDRTISTNLVALYKALGGGW
jgi:NodT family efflux transporter outer membrane factor (OMF) lipoprotein